MIEIKEAITRKEMKQFILFPFKLYKNDKNWVPPLITGEWNTFSRKKNPAFAHSEAAYFLAFKNGEVVGRIAAIINHKANSHWNDYRTRFGWFSFIDDLEVSKALLDAAEKWGNDKGMKGLHGPLGFTDMDSEGMLIEGFHNLPAITSAYNYPYFPVHMEKLGFSKATDWVQFKFNASQPVPEKVEKINQTVMQKYNLKVYIPQKKRGLFAYARKFFHTLNQSFVNLYGFSELSDEQIDAYIKSYLSFARPELICFVLDESDNVVGFGISFPSLSRAFQKARGRLFPFGFIHILKALRHFDTVDLYMTGVHPDWQKRGIHSLYYTAMNKQYIKYNIKTAISTGQLETNINAVGIWDNYQKEPYFRTRCYIKD